MTKKTKIYLAIFLLVFSFNAKAVLPLIWAGISAVNTAAGSLSAVQVGVLLTGAGAALYGTQMGYLDLKKSDDDGSVRIPLTNLTRDRPVANPDAPQTKPILNSPTVQPTTTSSFCGRVKYNYTFTEYICGASTFEAAEIAACLGYPASGAQCASGPYDGSNVYVSQQTQTTCPSGYTLNGTICEANQNTPTCEAGYTVQDGQCALTEPEKIPDKNCDLQVSTNSSGGKLIKNSSDPDCGSSPVNVSPDGVAYIPVTLNNPETGLPEEYHITVAPDGGSSNCYYAVCIPVAGLPGHYQIGVHSTGTAPNTTKYQAISVNSDGVVDGVRSGTIAGTIATSGTYTDANGQVQTIAPGQAVLIQTGVNGQAVQAVPAAPSQVINFPSDYARSGEASSAADKITQNLEQTDTMVDMPTPDLPPNPLVAALSPWTDWRPPVVVGSCPSGSFVVFSTTYNFDAACQLLESVASVIQSAMYLFFVVLAIFILLGA